MEDITNIAFEIVALAGDARSIYLQTLNEAKENKDKDKKTKSNLKKDMIEKMNEAKQLIVECHQKQTKLLQSEATAKKPSNVGMIMIHAQDHLMTCILLQELVEHIIELYGF